MASVRLINLHLIKFVLLLVVQVFDFPEREPTSSIRIPQWNQARRAALCADPARPGI